MNTSGVDEPPEIWVASVARLVSVSVGADTRVTWMPGYCFSNALISTVRASLAPVPLSGLADQTIEPDVVEHAGAARGRGAAAAALLLLALLLLLELLLPQPAMPRAPTTPTMAVSCQPFRWRLPGWLIDLARIMRPPLYVVTS